MLSVRLSSHITSLRILSPSLSPSREQLKEESFSKRNGSKSQPTTAFQLIIGKATFTLALGCRWVDWRKSIIALKTHSGRLSRFTGEPLWSVNATISSYSISICIQSNTQRKRLSHSSSTQVPRRSKVKTFGGHNSSSYLFPNRLSCLNNSKKRIYRRNYERRLRTSSCQFESSTSSKRNVQWFSFRLSN